MPRKVTVPAAAAIGEKWGAVTPQRQTYYAANAPPAGPTWESNTLAAVGTFKSAVAAGNIGQLFSGGVRKAGAAKYTRKVTDVGVGRFGTGVSAAITDMTSGIEPYTTVLAGLTLADKAPRGSPSNYSIVQAVGDPLHKKRLALLGAAGAS